jgi:hypothetical protein
MGTLINRVLRTTGLAAILSAIVVGSPNMAMASADRISQGEAQAVLNAGPSGISAILAKANDRAMARRATRRWPSGLTLIVGYITVQKTGT